MGSFLDWWQHIPEHLDPVIFQIGSFRLQYYGLMYILAFLTVYALARYRIRREPEFPYDDDFLKDILTYAFIGVLVGGRLGYVLFYNLGYYARHPLEIILPVQLHPFRFTGIAGMSYHGGLIGTLVACALFCRSRKANYWNLADLFFPVAPLGYTFGRLGNFINGELWGRATTAPVGMHFPHAPGIALRHPSQLYEATFEGLLLFAVLWSIRRRKHPEGAMAAAYLFGYGLVRFFIEFFRQPDEQLGFVLFNYFSRGQELCFLMMVAAGLLFIYLKRRQARLDRQPPVAAPAGAR